MPMEPKKWKYGAHEWEFEPPDILHCYVHGPVFLPDAQTSLQIMQEIAPAIGGQPFFVAYMNDGSFPPETRKFFGDITPCWKAIVVVGGSPMIRATTNLLVRASAILSGKEAVTKAVKTIEEGRAWMEDFRQKDKAAKTP